jgi:hypothetical protein
MIFLVGASAIYLTALQASIVAPRDAFQSCLKVAVDKAQSQKVDGDGYEAFVRTTCGTQMNSFKSAVTAFDMKNKMSRKDSSDDAEAMVADFVTGSANHYRYVIKSDPVASGKQAKAIEATAKADVTPAKPVATQAAAPINPQPPK